MFMNVVVGKPLVPPQSLLALDEQDWKNNEQPQTLFTESRYLPAILKEAGVVSSTSEVRKNKPELNISLEYPDCLWVKWGKKKIYIVVGE